MEKSWACAKIHIRMTIVKDTIMGIANREIYESLVYEDELGPLPRVGRDTLHANYEQ